MSFCPRCESKYGIVTLPKECTHCKGTFCELCVSSIFDYPRHGPSPVCENCFDALLSSNVSDNLLEQVAAHLTSLGLDYHMNPTASSLIVPVVTNGCKIQVEITTTTDSLSFLHFTAVQICWADYSVRPRAAYALVLLSSSLNLGRYNMDFSDGEISFVVSLPVESPRARGGLSAAAGATPQWECSTHFALPRDEVAYYMERCVETVLNHAPMLKAILHNTSAAVEAIVLGSSLGSAISMMGPSACVLRPQLDRIRHRTVDPLPSPVSADVLELTVPFKVSSDRRTRDELFDIRNSVVAAFGPLYGIVPPLALTHGTRLRLSPASVPNSVAHCYCTVLGLRPDANETVRLWIHIDGAAGAGYLLPESVGQQVSVEYVGALTQEVVITPEGYPRAAEDELARMASFISNASFNLEDHGSGAPEFTVAATATTEAAPAAAASGSAGGGPAPSPPVPAGPQAFVVVAGGMIVPIDSVQSGAADARAAPVAVSRPSSSSGGGRSPSPPPASAANASHSEPQSLILSFGYALVLSDAVTEYAQFDIRPSICVPLGAAHGTVLRTEPTKCIIVVGAGRNSLGHVMLYGRPDNRRAVTPLPRPPAGGWATDASVTLSPMDPSDCVISDVETSSEWFELDGVTPWDRTRAAAGSRAAAGPETSTLSAVPVGEAQRMAIAQAVANGTAEGPILAPAYVVATPAADEDELLPVPEGMELPSDGEDAPVQSGFALPADSAGGIPRRGGHVVNSFFLVSRGDDPDGSSAAASHIPMESSAVLSALGQ